MGVEMLASLWNLAGSNWKAQTTNLVPSGLARSSSKTSSAILNRPSGCWKSFRIDTRTSTLYIAWIIFVTDDFKQPGHQHPGYWLSFPGAKSLSGSTYQGNALEGYIQLQLQQIPVRWPCHVMLSGIPEDNRIWSPLCYSGPYQICYGLDNSNHRCPENKNKHTMSDRV